MADYCWILKRDSSLNKEGSAMKAKFENYELITVYGLFFVLLLSNWKIIETINFSIKFFFSNVVLCEMVFEHICVYID